MLRIPSDDNHGASVTMIKDICALLSSYNEKVSTESNKQYYSWMSPANVVFDQFTLKPKLRFEPLIYDSLGLKNRPLSI